MMRSGGVVSLADGRYRLYFLNFMVEGEYGGIPFLRNVGNHLQDNITS